MTDIYKQQAHNAVQQEIDQLKAELASQRAENERYRDALEKIASTGDGIAKEWVDHRKCYDWMKHYASQALQSDAKE